MTVLEDNINHPGTGIVEATRFLLGVAVRERITLFYVHFEGF